MSIVQNLKSKNEEVIFPVNHMKIPSKIPVKDIACDINPIIADPIDPKRISKESTNKITLSSVVKVGVVFLSTIASYYLLKNARISSYFGWGKKSMNSKDVNGNKILEVKNKAGALTERRNLKAASKSNDPFINGISKKYRDDKTVEFKEIEVEEFKDLSNVEKAKTGNRRSIIVENPIPDQNAFVGIPFNLNIDGSSVFKSTGGIFLEKNLGPAWLNSTNPAPTLEGSCAVDLNYKIAVSGDYAYVVGTSGLQIMNIADPSFPTFEGSYYSATTFANVVVFGNYAYVGGSKLQIIDISDPSNPTFISSYDPVPAYAFSIALSGNYIFLADDYISVPQIVDVSDPLNPTFKGSYDIPLHANDAAFSGNYVYLVGDDAYTTNPGLKILDVSNPTNLTLKGSYDTLSEPRGIAVSGNYAYVTNWDFGLQIIDVTNPSNPTFKSLYDMPGGAYGVAVSGNYAYVGDEDYMLQIIDISDPSNPTFKSSYDLSGKIAVSGNYAYLLDTWGLNILSSNLDKLKLSGTPSQLQTKYQVSIEACNEAMECIYDNFDIDVIVEGFSSKTFATTLIIIGSIIVLL